MPVIVREKPQLVAYVRTARWHLIVPLWLLVGSFGLARAYLYSLTEHSPPPSLKAVTLTATSVLLWAAITPFIFWVSDSFRLDRQRWRRHVGVHLLASFGCAYLDAICQLLVWRWSYHDRSVTMTEMFLRDLFINEFSYLVAAALAHAQTYYRLYLERQVRTAELETQLLKSQMQALKMQLTPHFLFNTLHAISGLIRTRQGPRAIKMIAGLGDLLRTVLRNEGVHEVPLRDELAFIQQYLHVERIRFDDRLQVRIDIGNAGLDAFVPHLILQPLVENAIRHGIETSEQGGQIEITANADATGMLWLCVRDSGHTPRPTQPMHEARGIGLANTRARLERLYGRRQRLELRETTDGGTEVRLGLPLHHAPLTEAA